MYSVSGTARISTSVVAQVRLLSVVPSASKFRTATSYSRVGVALNLSYCTLHWHSRCPQSNSNETSFQSTSFDPRTSARSLLWYIASIGGYFRYIPSSVSSTSAPGYVPRTRSRPFGRRDYPAHGPIGTKICCSHKSWRITPSRNQAATRLAVNIGHVQSVSRGQMGSAPLPASPVTCTRAITLGILIRLPIPLVSSVVHGPGGWPEI